MTSTGAEPAGGLRLVDERGRSLTLSSDGVDLFRYVYGPWDRPLESPRPYFHPLRTLSGRTVSLFRPWDHVWHKGLAWSLPNVGSQNFWGGPTYYRDRGYAQEDNNGSIVHTGFTSVTLDADRVTVDENLSWVASTGEEWFTERRAFAAVVEEETWTLAYSTAFTNVSGATVPIGSPTTEGRPNAGYGGLFWRGPRSFSNGRVYLEGRTGGDEMMGERGRWLAYSGDHDGVDGSSTLVFVDDTPGDEPIKWFVRTGIFACVCPAPFFDVVRPVEPGETLRFRYAVTFADGDTGPDGAARIAEAASGITAKLLPFLDDDTAQGASG
ncbi:PmoA family protein [Thermostaphylospora chromogena]|uniref:Methane oxygenase PmoA n=1 Tax=Thermostaphylospora chromogena TaxID=35622 RepID=A0A1H1D9R8_9ACTN|nr:PmoA family protein [Thermostaphylospora chromogena]SDQ73305.1 Methane oxygenase PmoA [Thermostaphylospora chromogena]